MKNLTELANEEIKAEDTKKLIARVKTLLESKRSHENEINEIVKTIKELETPEGAKSYLSSLKKNSNGTVYLSSGSSITAL